MSWFLHCVSQCNNLDLHIKCNHIQSFYKLEKRTNIYPSSVIAEFFIEKDNSMKRDVMKVLKLVYIAHGFYLAFTDSPLIKENVQAWQYGPVIPELYFRLKTRDLDASSVFFEDKERLKNDGYAIGLLNAVYNKYGGYTGIELSNLTHEKGTPWDITVNQYGSVIENELIKNHYKCMIS